MNLQNSQLAQKARALGFSETLSASVLVLGSPRDANAIRAQAGGLISVESLDGELLRTAAKNRGVQLVNPLNATGFSRDDGLIRIVAEQGKAFEIPISTVLRSKHVFRAKAMNQIREFSRRCFKLGAKIVFTSRAQEEWDVKSPREIIAIASLLGFSREQASAAIGKNAFEILDKLNNREAADGKMMIE